MLVQFFKTFLKNLKQYAFFNFGTYVFLKEMFHLIFIIILSVFTNRGTFRMEREDGHLFDCRIPPFSLESKPDDKVTFNTV